jgi:glyceraldehyde-3-phosphate dehydrogenase/erythrose-4-phosphate dehydrogenase
MSTKIHVNGFGRIGKMWAMAQTWPYLIESQRRVMTQSMKEQERRDIEEIDRLHGSVPEAQKTYVLARKPDNSYTIHLSESDVTDIVVDTSELPKARYHDRIFPKDYAKKKKAKRRQQKQSRRRR